MNHLNKEILELKQSIKNLEIEKSELINSIGKDNSELNVKICDLAKDKENVRININHNLLIKYDIFYLIFNLSCLKIINV